MKEENHIIINHLENPSSENNRNVLIVNTNNIPNNSGTILRLNHYSNFAINNNLNTENHQNSINERQII